MPNEFREVQSITMKRKHISLTGDDQYGHWWLEIGNPMDATSESYGWWPQAPVGYAGTFAGVLGELNGQTNFGGTATRDPHHGDDADEEFHPLVPISDIRTDAEIEKCIRTFANGYGGTWQWVFGKGQNCHTFQAASMKHCRLVKRAPKGWI